MARVLYLVTVILTAGSIGAVDPVGIVVEQEGCPVSIESYSPKYDDGYSEYSNKGIHHKLKYSNVADSQIVAVSIGLVSFSVFNQFLSKTNGIDIDDLPPRKSGKGTWIDRCYSAFSFLTGVAYVNKVRFRSGEIWTADMDDVVEELRRIQSDFVASSLDDKDKNE